MEPHFGQNIEQNLESILYKFNLFEAKSFAESIICTNHILMYPSKGILAAAVPIICSSLMSVSSRKMLLIDEGLVL